MTEVRRNAPESWSNYLQEYKASWRELHWVWSDLTSDEGRRFAMWFVFLSALTLLVLTLQPLVFSWLVNAVDEKNTQLAMLVFWMLFGLSIMQRGAALANHLVREWLWNRNMFQLHNRINALFYEKTLGQLSDEGSTLNYESIERAKNRVDGLQEMLLFETVQVLLTIMWALGLLYYVAWEAGLILTMLLLLQIAWSLYLNYHTAVETVPIEREFRAENRQMVERWNMISRVKTNGKAHAEQERLSTWFDEILHRDKTFWFWFTRVATVRDFVGDIVRIALLGYGAYLVLYTGDKEIGFLVPLFTWVTQVIQNLWYFGHAERRINENIPYIKAMREALTLTPLFNENTGTCMDTDAPVSVEFKGVGLNYRRDGVHGSVATLRDISFRIEPGEKVALIGASGAGKSTIMKLLLRFMDPTEGEIWINGHRLRDLKLTSWMERAGYIAQESQVFDGTIRYNLTFGLSAERQRSITDEEIWDVMRLLQIDFGDRLTDGLDTKVGRDGLQLSGGQRQRLMAGAAVIKGPIFMIIDEATSSLDSTTEKEVQRGLQQVLSGPVGALIVAHRLSTVRSVCDKFIVLRKLEDMQEGESQIEAIADSFETLYDISPTFRQLADDQEVRILAK